MNLQAVHIRLAQLNGQADRLAAELADDPEVFEELLPDYLRITSAFSLLRAALRMPTALRAGLAVLGRLPLSAVVCR